MLKIVLKSFLGVLLLATAALVAMLYLAPERVAASAVTAERERAGLVRKEITLADGLRYVYLEGGSGTPLLLLHGFGADKDNFLRVARGLTPKYRVVIPDHIGFGESDRPADIRYTPREQARRLQGLMTALGISKLHVGGNSMGGHISLEYAAEFPELVQSLWILNAGGFWNSAPQSELNQVIARTGKNPLLAQSREEFRRTVDFVMAKPPYIPGPVLNVMADRRIANAELEQIIFKQLRSESVEERIRGLNTPTLVVWGDQDRAIHPGTAAVIDQLMPNAEVIMLPGIGHLPMLEDPKQVTADYLAFRGRLGYR